MKTNLKISSCLAFLLASSCVNVLADSQVKPVTSQPPVEKAATIEPIIEYEISRGNVTFFLNHINAGEIDNVTLDGKPIDLFYSEGITTDTLEDGLVVRLDGKEKMSGAGLIEITLADGRKVSRSILGGPVQSLDWLTAASCTEAPGIYNAVKCDSTTSEVGTPPYPCCDNDGDSKATGSTDGNCTWYAWYRAKQNGWTVPSTWGGAGSWCANAAKSTDWKVSSIPSINTIACSSSIGHVGWVTAVSTDKKTITVAEQNCKVPPSCFASGTRSKSGYNASSFQYISKGRPDLIVTSVTGPTQGTRGQSISVQWKVKNQGINGADPHYSRLYFSTDRTITTSDIAFGDCNHSSGIATGLTINCSGNLIVPTTLTPRTYYLGAIADYKNVVAESSENNNATAASGTITVR